MTPKVAMPRYPVLDGWRGFSILCILAAHFLPLGLKSWQLNEVAGLLGMSIFFTLSGFLISSILLRDINIKNFLIRRLMRIVPLAWLFLVIALPLAAVPLKTYLPHFLFYANLPPFYLNGLTAHFWSLGVEVQFYIGIALLVLLLKQRGLLLLPFLCLAITGLRILHGQNVSIVTYYRVDEILVGCCLALAYNQRLGESIPKLLGWINPFICLGCLIISCHPASGWVNYLRPYFAFLLVGTTLSQESFSLSRWLLNTKLAYIASISYALYVIHPLMGFGWLGDGDTLVKYAKRPLTFLLTFIFAHLSTFYYEKYWISLGKKWTSAGKPATSV
jgi:peptidoglycan/LPS O-acetylase OafA/YrhL